MRPEVNRIVDESVPPPPSPERPPLAPYDPPDPAPQAAAWRRALKVVTAQTAAGGFARSQMAGSRSRSQVMG
jgi:hypothetical protein